jgi:hypothetical protein
MIKPGHHDTACEPRQMPSKNSKNTPRAGAVLLLRVREISFNIPHNADYLLCSYNQLRRSGWCIIPFLFDDLLWGAPLVRVIFSRMTGGTRAVAMGRAPLAEFAGLLDPVPADARVRDVLDCGLSRGRGLGWLPPGRPAGLR